MDKLLLKKHLLNFKHKQEVGSEKFFEFKLEREQRVTYYQSFTREKILKMTREDIFEYLSKLWGMLIWGNKEYYVDKIIQDNGFEKFKIDLADLIWGTSSIEKRWDNSMDKMKGLGPAIKSELLCHTHPNDYILWNRRAYVGLEYLGVENLPRYNYQIDGKKYKELSENAKEISKEMTILGFEDTSLLSVDYFIWEELQVVDKLSNIHKKVVKEIPVKDLTKEESKFVHNEVRDTIRDIGEWLGFKAEIEKKVADGSVVDTVWESKIGNMGRVMYVFEVQTKGSIDSLILNLLKARNNPAVQGVVAVSDRIQLERIKKACCRCSWIGISSESLGLRGSFECA